jgi:hypothetical protein
MLFSKREKIIQKQIKVLVEGAISAPYKKDTIQKFLRTTYWVLFIPIYTYDKRID